jgi:hypothetical protein
MLWGIDESLLFFIAVAIFLGVIELGFRLGLRHRDDNDDAARTHITALQSALLGLLALLLGFTFAMAVSRFETRKTLVLEEANAIGKAFWRSQLIKTTRRDELAKQLKAYVASRVVFHLAASNEARVESAHAASTRIAQQIWQLASAIEAEDPRSSATTLFIQSVNDMIDVNEKRRVALENHVPEPVHHLLFLVAVGALAFIAYGSGLNGRRRIVSTGIFATLIAMVLTFIVDIDQPGSGLIVVSQESMLRLKATLDRSVL